MKIIKIQKSVGFISGIAVAAFFFFISHCCKERHAMARLVRLFWDRLEAQRRQSRQESADAGEGECHCRCSCLEAFLKTYQPEIVATLINILEMAQISLEDYFEALEVKEDWHKFQKLMGEVSLMVMEQSQIPEGKGRESTVVEVRERYIPRLIAAVETFKATFA